jgi:hypothetical protein
MRLSMKQKILELLKDGHWHGCSDLLTFGLSYRNRLSELRDEGYQIISEKQEGKPTYRYMLLPKEEVKFSTEIKPPEQQTLLMLQNNSYER